MRLAALPPALKPIRISTTPPSEISSSTAHPRRSSGLISSLVENTRGNQGRTSDT